MHEIYIKCPKQASLQKILPLGLGSWGQKNLEEMWENAYGFGVYFRGDEILLNLLWCWLHNCEYMKNYLIVSFKGMNGMVCKLYINKNIKKKEKGGSVAYYVYFLNIYRKSVYP